MRICLFILLSVLISQDSTSLSPLVGEAIQDYENLIEKFPEMKGLNFNLANIHSKTGNMKSAMNQYEQALSSEDDEIRAHALYNMGNLQFEKGEIEESSKLFREALKLSSEDQDILHNYALSQKVLKEQKEQKQDQEQDSEQNSNDSDSEKEEGEPEESEEGKEQEEQKQDQEQDSEQNPNDGDSEKEEGESEESEERKEQEEEENESQESDEQKEEEKDGGQGEPQAKELTEEQKRNVQEAEAILNALKADKNNLKKKIYKAKGRVTLEKDW